MRILAAGGAGYIGSILVPMLQEHGYDVDVADLLWFGNHLPEGTPIIQKDLFTMTDAKVTIRSSSSRASPTIPWRSLTPQ
jgi:UDP-glucose 4-epimerase